MEKSEFDLDHKKEREAKKLVEKSYGFDAFGYYMLLFSKFIISKTQQVPAKTFPAPEVPKGFNLVHKFEDGEYQGSEKSYAKTASDRAQILGETQQAPSSIFDLVSDKDRDFLKSLKQNQESATKVQEENKKVQTTTRKKKITRDERYEQYVKYVKQSLPNPYSLIDTQDLTEWEKEKEKNEFQVLYEAQIKKMEAIKNMGSKFVSTKILTKEGQEVEDEQLKHMFFEKASTEISSKPESEIEKAAREKKFGQLTRTQFEWRPHHILCRRFNLPNPYPE
jgi:G patch domain-containing protein 1